VSIQLDAELPLSIGDTMALAHVGKYKSGRPNDPTPFELPSNWNDIGNGGLLGLSCYKQQRPQGIVGLCHQPLNLLTSHNGMIGLVDSSSCYRPTPFMARVLSSLSELGIIEDRVRHEFFGPQQTLEVS
jgi:hypothetical protein